MIDCHILVHPTTPKEWVEQAISSVYKAMNNTTLPVALSILPAVEGHIGEARFAGYSMGTNPYVTSVDDDDWVDEDAFKCLEGSFHDNPIAVLTRHKICRGERVNFISDYWDNLRVFRRELLDEEDHTQWPVWYDQALLAKAHEIGPVVGVNKPVYNYRYHNSPHKILMKSIDRETLDKLKLVLKKPGARPYEQFD